MVEKLGLIDLGWWLLVATVAMSWIFRRVVVQVLRVAAMCALVAAGLVVGTLGGGVLLVAVLAIGLASVLLFAAFLMFDGDPVINRARDRSWERAKTAAADHAH